MASISTSSNGRKTIHFVAADRKRRKIHLGRSSERNAQQVCLRVECLLAAARDRTPLDKETAAWVKDLKDEMAAKLARVGLIESRQTPSIDRFLTAYIAERGDVKEMTRTNLVQAKRFLA